VLIIVISIAIPAIVASLYFTQGLIGSSGDWVHTLPHINAIINGSTAILLLFGRYKIKQGNRMIHKRIMISAFVLGIVFLICYITYHASVPSTHYGGQGYIRYLYFFLLITHILTAAAVVPFILLALYFALHEKFATHKKIVKFGYPMWLYVSITGIIVYLMIKPFY